MSASRTLKGLAPILGPGVRLVILGSFPGVASLQAQQYYGHPRNHFWRLLATALGPDPEAIVAAPYPKRVTWLLQHGIGLWDVYAACEREGSLDSAIRSPEPNDLSRIARACPELRVIAHNGGESWRHRRFTEALGVTVMRLPSSSPANASWSFEKKLAAWRDVLAEAGLSMPSKSATNTG